MSKYYTQAIFDCTLQVKCTRMGGIQKYRACFQVEYQTVWNPIPGSRWEVKREDAERFLDRYARFRRATKIE